MEPLKHECGIAMIRLLKPLEYYRQKYGTALYGLNKLYLMMEKEHNRGQEGAGIASVKLEATPGKEYMFREKEEGSNAITQIFANVHKKYNDWQKDNPDESSIDYENMPFVGNLYMGHLRYSTTGKKGLTYVHPFLRRNNWRAKNLCLCGNFNMTNIDQIFKKLTRQGQCPRKYSDSYIMLELMGHRLDREVERNFVQANALGLEDQAITDYIENNVDMANVLDTSMKDFDGGYVICGMTGSGEMFSMRDPWGLRPAYYYKDDEIVAIASERPVLQTTFDLACEDIKELEPGQALIVKKNGNTILQQIIQPGKKQACSFERIYFSRGCDRDIYQERKKLGQLLVPSILQVIDYDTQNTVFSFIPNTAEVAFYGMVHGLNDYITKQNCKKIAAQNKILTEEEINNILTSRVRVEKVAWKDIKLRTFITEGKSRKDLASHVYDITYESIKAGKDNLVIIDDSIVRGTTLKESILRILDRLSPKKIVVVSSAPQIRYPDYYGIDMPRLEEFSAFRATIALIKERNMHDLILKTYKDCQSEISKEISQISNKVRQIYEPFTVEEINNKMVQMLKPQNTSSPIEIIFQSIEGLHQAIPHHNGDWFFTGNYPTPGGMKLCNQAFIDYVETKYQYEQKL